MLRLFFYDLSEHGQFGRYPDSYVAGLKVRVDMFIPRTMPELQGHLYVRYQRECFLVYLEIYRCSVIPAFCRDKNQCGCLVLFVCLLFCQIGRQIQISYLPDVICI